jgi:N-acetyl sugar amidotransferase
LKASLPSPEARDRLLAETLDRIKAAGRGRKYDCVLGLSGGVDSSYLCHIAHQHGLRPLIVHFDNGWNSELAVANIEKLVEKYGYDLHTFVMDWDEFRDLQRAYFKASVLDLEVPTDHMIFGALNKIAMQSGIKTILSGTNLVTEWLLPKSWYYPKYDLKNLLGIHSQFGERPLKKLPKIGVWQTAGYHARGLRSVALLDLIDYDKASAKSHLINNVGWRDYGGKHYESVFTRFYQGYILPNKFGIDKRKAHLSSLILSEQMSRDDALEELKQPTYDEDLQRQDFDYVAKKLGFSTQEFQTVLTLPNRSHLDYGTDKADRIRYTRMVKLLGGIRRWGRFD